MQTTRMIGSRKFAELQAFPLDPTDFAILKERVAPDSIAFYLRLLYDDRFRTVVLLDRPRNITRMWRLFEQQNKGQPPSNHVLAGLVERVYEAFVEQPVLNKIDAGKIALKMLCLHYHPKLRSLTEVPHDNVVGVILQFEQCRLTEHCYIQFALDDVPALTASIH